MSAVVCGKRSLIFEDHTIVSSSSSSSASSSSSPPASNKRIRCVSSASSARLLAVDRLVLLFPHMDKLVIERILNQCGDDIETTIKSLTELRLVSNENAGPAVGEGLEYQLQTQSVLDVAANGVANGEAGPFENSPHQKPVDGADWVDLFVKEMLSASNIDDARTRASRALEMLEKSTHECVTTEAHGLTQENMMMKEQLQALMQENSLLKRAVAIQHERQKEFKQMVSQCQEQLRTLEVNNYSLTMHLKQAQQGSSMPGRFHPDVI